MLITSRCVIWSRGGVFRKSYKFDLEKEEVTQALLTTFPNVGPLAGKVLEARAPAIVVFLKTQAHVKEAVPSHSLHKLTLKGLLPQRNEPCHTLAIRSRICHIRTQWNHHTEKDPK